MLGVVRQILIDIHFTVFYFLLNRCPDVFGLPLFGLFPQAANKLCKKFVKKKDENLWPEKIEQVFFLVGKISRDFIEVVVNQVACTTI